MPSEAMEPAAFGCLRRPELDGAMTVAWEMPNGQVIFVRRGLNVLMRRSALGWELFERRDVVP